ncbi:MAG: ABC transporter substrate-binding protein [Proteobacteria bacterium]|nr:ABC transporter substrate-binding protein [Pseudomonadota bacterium]MBI3496190.1 ABC transporter substrate-binding protein [Pseudomonadota bacterium]
MNRLFLAGLAAVAASAAALAEPAEVNMPVLVPLTGPVALEGTSQQNGALLALRNAPAGVKAHYLVMDVDGSPEQAVNGLERVLSRGPVSAVTASIFGPQMLAMLPIALERKVPLITISGTTDITERGNPYVFRFFPTDAVAKVAHARYAVEILGKGRPALIYQTTAYGQSGATQLRANLQRLGVELVFEEALDPTVKDMLPVLAKARDAKPDVLLLHLHQAPTALVIRQAAAMRLGLPIVAGSAAHSPATAALLDPAELAGVCTETNAAPAAGGSPALERFLAQYREAFGSEPDGYALGQYDGVMMVLDAAQHGAGNAAEIAAALSRSTYQGLAQTYRSDGKGNMAHGAIIMCYDGTGRVPRIVKSYENVTGVLAR